MQPELARLQRIQRLAHDLPRLRRAAVRALVEKGWTYGQIAQEMGISRQAVWELAHERKRGRKPGHPPGEAGGREL